MDNTHGFLYGQQSIVLSAVFSEFLWRIRGQHHQHFTMSLSILLLSHSWPSQFSIWVIVVAAINVLQAHKIIIYLDRRVDDRYRKYVMQYHTYVSRICDQKVKLVPRVCANKRFNNLLFLFVLTSINIERTEIWIKLCTLFVWMQ